MVDVGLTADLPVTEAARVIMAQELGKILEFEQNIRRAAATEAVYEMRKCIRRTFTCFKLFAPYFEHQEMRTYRRGLRKIMRRLARSRDLAVFQMKLATYNHSIPRPLVDLADYWQSQQKIADATLQTYLAHKKRRKFIKCYQRFIENGEQPLSFSANLWKPLKIGHIAPILIYQRVAAVRAFGDYLAGATTYQLHRLRIQFKELRYSLDFFTGLLGEKVDTVLVDLKQSQDHLGDLNDATVALSLLDEVPNLKQPVNQYRDYQRQVSKRLVETYLPIWRTFDRPQWRHDLAEAVATL